jgi:hypothetical protein
LDNATPVPTARERQKMPSQPWQYAHQHSFAESGLLAAQGTGEWAEPQPELALSTSVLKSAADRRAVNGWPGGDVLMVKPRGGPTEKVFCMC